MEKRLDYIDVARGIAIILVVWGHACWYYTGIINYFHVPLFFFISGYVLSFKKPIKNLLISKVKGLYIPFIVSQFVFILLNNVLCLIGFVSDEYSMKDITINILRSFYFDYVHILLSQTWFLVCLFISIIIVVVVHKVLKKAPQWVFVIVSFTLYVITNILSIKGIKFFFANFNIGCVILTIFFIELGLFCREIKLKFNNIVIAVLCVVALGVSYKVFGLSVDVRSITTNNMVLALVASLSGIYFIMTFSNYISKIKISVPLQYIGKNSIWIMILHFVSTKIVGIIQVSFFNYPHDSLSGWCNVCTSRLWGVIYIIVGVGVPLIIRELYHILIIQFKKVRRS